MGISITNPSGGGGGIDYTSSGTTNYLPKYDGSGWADSLLYESGTSILNFANAATQYGDGVSLRSSDANYAPPIRWYRNTSTYLAGIFSRYQGGLSIESPANTFVDIGGSSGLSSWLKVKGYKYDTTGTGVLITSQAAGVVPMDITLASAQSANALNITSNGGSAGDLFKIAANGAVTLAAGSPYIYGDTTNQYVRLDAGAVFLSNGSINYVELNGELKLRGGGNEVAFGNGNVRFSDNHLQLSEKTAPTGTANAATIYAEDNGSGKTRLMVIFGTGAAQQIAIEP